MPGGCEVPSFWMEKVLGVPGHIFVPIQCTCNSCHRRLGPLMRPRTPPSGHSYSSSQRQQPSQRWHGTPAWVGGCHFLSCASGLQEDSRGGAWVGRILGEFPARGGMWSLLRLIVGPGMSLLISVNWPHSLPLTSLSKPSRKNLGARA